jgi:hypothetical protein
MVSKLVCVFEPVAIKYGIIFFVYIEDNLYLTYLVSHDRGTVSFHVVACNVCRIFFWNWLRGKGLRVIKNGEII